MMHYKATRIRKGYGEYDHCLCLNGSYDENCYSNLTKIKERINCPSCLAILELAQKENLPLNEATIKYIQTK